MCKRKDFFEQTNHLLAHVLISIDCITNTTVQTRVSRADANNRVTISSGIASLTLTLERLIVIDWHARAELTAWIHTARVKLNRTVVAIEAWRAFAYVHVGQWHTTGACSPVLAWIRTAVVDRYVASKTSISRQASACESVRYAIANAIITAWA